MTARDYLVPFVVRVRSATSDRWLKPLAVTGLKRNPLHPDGPSFEKSGYSGFDGAQWYGIVGPAKLPPEITRKLNAEINRALSAPAPRDRVASEACKSYRRMAT